MTPWGREAYEAAVEAAHFGRQAEYYALLLARVPRTEWKLYLGRMVAPKVVKNCC